MKINKQKTLQLRRRIKKARGSKISVYKSLDVLCGMYCSPAFFHIWKLGENQSSRYDPILTEEEKQRGWVDVEGFYVYLTREEARRSGYSGKPVRLIAFEKDLVICDKDNVALFTKLTLPPPRKPRQVKPKPKIKKKVKK
jgi:hypothetical protein